MTIKFGVNIKSDAVQSIAKMRQDLAQLPEQAHKFFVGITPKDTGSARKNTSRNGNIIHADYAYAQRLDNGWSKQYGGKGMTKPTTEFIQKRLKQITGK